MPQSAVELGDEVAWEASCLFVQGAVWARNDGYELRRSKCAGLNEGMPVAVRLLRAYELYMSIQIRRIASGRLQADLGP